MTTVYETRNARYVTPDESQISLEWNHPDLGWIPFLASPDDVEEHGRDIYAAAISAGGIGPYVPPTAEQIRANMPPLMKWRFDSIIDLQPGLRGQIDAAIEAMAEPTRTISRNKLLSVTEFVRTDPLFDQIGQAVGITPEQIDSLWADALNL